MKNYLLFIIDSLNYSHVKQSSIDLMPFFHNIAKQSIICENMYSQAPYTEAAVMNIYCGQNVLDHGGYLKRFKNSPQTIFEVMRHAGYKTYYNSFQPQCFPSSLRRGIDDIFYNVGFDLEALWSYRLEHYAVLLRNNKLDKIDYQDLTEILDDNFTEWLSFLHSYTANDKACDLIQGNSKYYEATYVLSDVEREYGSFKNAPKKYVKNVLLEGKGHSLFSIPAYIQDFKVKDQDTLQSVCKLFKPLMREIRCRDIQYNIKNRHIADGALSKFEDYVKHPCKATLKDLLKAAYLAVNVLFDLDLYKRVTNNYDSFKAAPSARTHIDHFLHWAEMQDAPYFACVHVDDIHNPEVFFTYDSTDMSLLQADYHRAEIILKQLPKTYKGSITHDLSLRYADSVIEYMLSEMKSRNYLSDTCVIITADHGFSFSGNPIRDSFVINLYLENYNIPCLIYNSGKDAEVISKICTSKDIPATICDLAFSKVPDSFTGHSIFESHNYPEVMIEYCGGGCPDLRRRDLKIAAFDNKWFVGAICPLSDAFSRENITEVYNLMNDPEQLHNCKWKEYRETDIQHLILAIEERFVDLRRENIRECE